MFRELEKSPGLSLLWGAGPQQLQLPGLALLPHPHPLPCAPVSRPPRGPVSVSVPVSVMGSHLAPLLSACLFVSVILGRMVILRSPGVLGQKQAEPSPGPQTSPDPVCRSYLDTGVNPKCSERSPS